MRGYPHKVPNEDVTATDLAWLQGDGPSRGSWVIVVAWLYLRVGLQMPEAAKRRGVYFGRCDASGQPDPAGDHFGFGVENPHINEGGEDDDHR